MTQPGIPASEEPRQGGVEAAPLDEAALEREYRLNRPEEIVTFALFWVMTVIVFLQFFTRYVLNDSLTWTEEAARYLLIIITFLGCGIAVRRNSHIYVEMLYRYMPRGVSQTLGTVVDIGRAVLLGLMAYLCMDLANRLGFQRMNLIDMSVSVIYWIVAAGLAGAAIRAVLLAVQHWRRGHPMVGLAVTKAD